MNDNDINSLLKILSKMDKKDLEKGIQQAQNVLKNKDAGDILNNLKK